MNDFEARLRNSLRHNLDPIDASSHLPEDVASKARTRRFIMIVGTGTAVVLLAASTVWTASMLSSNPSQLPAAPSPTTTPTESAPAPRAGWVVHTDESDDASIEAPETWKFNPDPTPQLVSPNLVFALASGSVPSGGECAPTAAIETLPPDGTLFWMLEYSGTENPYEVSPRPSLFDLGPLGGPVECVGEKTHLVLFRDAGRFFQVHIMFGPKAGEELRSEVVDSLSTFDPSPSGRSFTEQCQEGPWIYCARAAWVFSAVNQARFFHWGNTGSAIEIERGDHRVYIWTTSEDQAPSAEEGYRPAQEIDGVTIYSDGERLAWNAQGAYVWVEKARRDSSLPEGAALEDLVKATLEVRFVDDAE